jgi:hypothetical protein
VGWSDNSASVHCLSEVLRATAREFFISAGDRNEEAENDQRLGEPDHLKKDQPVDRESGS